MYCRLLLVPFWIILVKARRQLSSSSCLSCADTPRRICLFSLSFTSLRTPKKLFPFLNQGGSQSYILVWSLSHRQATPRTQRKTALVELVSARRPGPAGSRVPLQLYSVEAQVIRWFNPVVLWDQQFFVRGWPACSTRVHGCLKLGTNKIWCNGCKMLAAAICTEHPSAQ